MSEKDATTKAKSIDTDSLKKAVETINTMKAKMQDKKAEILAQVEVKKKEYEELTILYRELFGPLPWDSHPKISQVLRGIQKVVWSGNWNGLRDALLRAGYLIVSTNW